MSEVADLKRIERRAWTSYFDDGLWDIFLGAMFLIGGIRALTENVWYTLLVAPLVLVLPVGKKLVTTPRLGYVKFGPARKLKLGKAFIALTVSVLTIFTLQLLTRSGLSLPIVPMSPIMAVWIAVFFGILAYYLDFRRLYAYGLLYAISEVLWGQFGKSIGAVTQTIWATAILLVGLIVFARFLRKYPLPAEGILDVKG
jgi:hypothetical protein